MNACMYKTSKSGARMERTEITFVPFVDVPPPFAPGGQHPGDVEGQQLRIYPQIKYQRFQGFGAAITESAAVAWGRMPQKEQDRLIQLYFSEEEGIGYTVGRLAIGGCDFSVSPYSYVEEGDMTLDSFDISREDPTVFAMVKAAMQHQKGLHLFASPWTPPRYMKTVNEWQGGSLKEEFYSLWADYVVKYIEECRARGISIEAITVQNEPRHHQMWESCTYTAEQELALVKQALAPRLKPMGVKIYVYDHCKERLLERAEHAFAASADVDGIACHWYSGDYFDELRMVRERFPDKEIIMSEGCVALQSTDPDHDTRWAAAERYIHDISGNINAGLTAFCDWNITLDEQRGPSHFRVGRPCSADAPVICDTRTGTVIPQPSFFAIGHYSKFIREGAVILGSSRHCNDIELLAAQNPDGSVVGVIYNSTDAPHPLTLHLGNHIFSFTAEQKSIYTVVIPQV